MSEKIINATHEGPLILAGIEIPAYVLEDGTRLLSQRGLQTSIGISKGGAAKVGAQRIGLILARLLEKGFKVDELMARIKSPIVFQPTHGGRTAYGYEATILADMCDVIFEANKHSKLLPQQKHIAERCEILMRAFAKVGIIALVDEATGYQEVRDKMALQKILEMYIAQELRPWIKTFQDDFYEQLFRLRNWPYKPVSVKRPSVVGKITNDLVYKRLAPGILDELKKITPRDDEGHLKHKYHQRLSENIGYVKLKEHLASVTTLMKASPNWSIFYRLIQRALPQFGKTIELPFTDREIEKMALQDENNQLGQ